MQKLCFRKARPEDGKEILRIYDESIHYDDATYLTECPSWSQWDSGHNRDYRIVASLDGKVVGFVVVTDKISGQATLGEVSIYVDSRYRQEGIGHRLLQCLIHYNDFSNENQNNNFHLFHSVIFTNNRASIRLHEKAGFHRVAYRKNSLSKNGRWRDVYVYEHRNRVV